MEGITNKFSASSITAPSTSWQSITWSNDENPTNKVIRIGNTTTRINLGEGRYLVHSHFWGDLSGSARANVRTRISKNGTQLPGSYGSGYLRNGNNDDLSVDGWCIVESDGTDYITMDYIRGSDINVSANVTKTFIEIIKIDSTTDFAHLSDNTQNASLGDGANNTFDVYWDNEIIPGTNITVGGSNDEEITLAANKRYLIICNVNFNSNGGNRTSRTINPLINGTPITGVVGDEFMRNSSNPYGSPNFLCIHETGDSSETLKIISRGPFEYSSYIVNGGVIQRVVNTSGLFIMELSEQVKYYKCTANTIPSFTGQNIATNGIDINVDEVFEYKRGGDIYHNTSYGLDTIKKRKYLIYSQIYIASAVHGSSRLTRAISITINGTRQSVHDGIIYIRNANSSQDVPQGTAQTGGIFELNADDTIGIEFFDDGYDDGNTPTTNSSFIPVIFIIDLKTLRPEFTDLETNELSFTADLLRNEYTSGVTPQNRGLGEWAGEMGMFNIPGQASRPWLNNQTNISMREVHNFYMRFGNNAKRRYQDANSIDYWFIPIQLEAWNFCIYDTTDYYLYGASSSGWGVYGSSIGGGSVESEFVSVGDVIASTNPISIYGDGSAPYYSALCSKWGGYLFSQFVYGANTDLVIFTLDDETDIIVSSTSSGIGYSNNIEDTFSVSFSDAFSFTVSRITTADKLYVISANKPIVCGLYSNGNYGYQLYPMQQDEILYGYAEIDGNIITIPNGIDFNETNIVATSTSYVNGDVNTYTENIVGTDWFYGAERIGVNATLVSSSFDNPLKTIVNNGVLNSMMGYGTELENNLPQHSFVSEAAKSNIFVINTSTMTRIGAVHDSPVDIDIYNSTGNLLYSSSLSLSNGLYNFTIGNDVVSFEQGGWIITSNYCNIWANIIDESENVFIYYLHGTRDVQGFPEPEILNSSSLYPANNQTDACGRRFPQVSIWHNDTTFASSVRFYADSSGTTPLPNNTYYSDGVNWVVGDGVNCVLTVNSC
jgi:hypothetical protein